SFNNISGSFNLDVFLVLFRQSQIGNKLLYENIDHIPLKYVAVLTTVFHIKNKIELWKDLCNNGIFDI
ncbi:MAG: hypothetical protein K8S18_08965, partial [Desulfobacula sp.]|nr:hypothetical protein [Desulfobacula sp.]